MKNLATLALLGFTSAHFKHHEMQKKFGKPNETDKNDSFGKNKFTEVTDADFDAGLNGFENTP